MVRARDEQNGTKEKQLVGLPNTLFSEFEKGLGQKENATNEKQKGLYISK